jgi:hypothetical protein
MIHAMTARSGRLVWLVLPFLCLAGAAWATEASDLLAAVAFQAQAPRLLRADLRIEREGAAPVEAVLLEDGQRRYLETKNGTRALLSPGKVLVARGGSVVRAGADATLDGSDVLLEDLAPFGNRAIDVPQVSDAGPTGTVVTAAPRRPTAYALLVYTVDPERDVIVQTKYYRDTINNLVKMAKFADFVTVAGRRRPGTMTVETFRPAPRTTRIVFRWREAPDIPPAVFTTAGLRAPSPIRWP